MKRKGKTIISLLILITLSACIKESTGIDLEQLRLDEITAREQYLKDNNITVAPTESGLYYIETAEGPGEAPTEGVKVEVNYEGSLLDGTVFEEGTVDYRYGTDMVIAGLDEAISYMKKGGTATAIIPSELAHGANQTNSIPPYSTLIFKLELVEVYGAEKEIKDRELYISENEIITDSTETGLYYIETLAGDGATPVKNDIVEVKYVGKFLDGTIFDSGIIDYTHDIGGVIAGLDEAVGYMKVGGKASLIIPSKLGYGPIGNSAIPGYTTLLFDIELITIK